MHKAKIKVSKQLLSPLSCAWLSVTNTLDAGNVKNRHLIFVVTMSCFSSHQDSEIGFTVFDYHNPW